MIIDITYIKNALNTDVEDSKIQYLLHHYFNDVCEQINVETTLEDQELSDENIMIDVVPQLGVDELSLFQETIIYGIACHLINTGISITSMPTELYNEYISQIDLSTLSLDDDGFYIIDFYINFMFDFFPFCIWFNNTF